MGVLVGRINGGFPDKELIREFKDLGVIILLLIQKIRREVKRFKRKLWRGYHLGG
jgi:hypothetical protein